MLQRCTLPHLGASLVQLLQKYAIVVLIELCKSKAAHCHIILFRDGRCTNHLGDLATNIIYGEQILFAWKWGPTEHDAAVLFRVFVRAVRKRDYLGGLPNVIKLVRM